MDLLLKSLIILGITLLAIFVLIKDRKKAFPNVVLFSLFFLSYSFVISLPDFFPALNIEGTYYNWTGKILGILWGTGFYFIIKKHLPGADYFRFKQAPRSLKPNIIITLILTVIGVVVSVAFWNGFDWNAEQLLFQLTIPGLDEEIGYRGILLGLLSADLLKNIKIFSIKINSAVLIVSIIFGLIHGLNVGTDLSVHFNAIYTIQTALTGYIWGWMAVKSKSIIMPMISHNAMNFFGTLALMIK